MIGGGQQQNVLPLPPLPLTLPPLTLTPHSISIRSRSPNWRLGPTPMYITDQNPDQPVPEPAPQREVYTGHTQTSRRARREADVVNASHLRVPCGKAQHSLTQWRQSCRAGRHRQGFPGLATGTLWRGQLLSPRGYTACTQLGLRDLGLRRLFNEPSLCNVQRTPCRPCTRLGRLAKHGGLPGWILTHLS
jgi:hypothetical protein